MIKCVICLTENDDESETCVQCGEELDAEVSAEEYLKEKISSREDDEEDLDDEDLDDDEDDDEDEDDEDLDEEEEIGDEIEEEKLKTPIEVKQLLDEVETRDAEIIKYRKVMQKIKKEKLELNERFKELEKQMNYQIQQIGIRQEEEKELKKELERNKKTITELSWVLYRVSKALKDLPEGKKQQFKDSGDWDVFSSVYERFIYPRKTELINMNIRLSVQESVYYES